MMGTEIFKIDASWAEKLTKTRVQFLLTPTVLAFNAMGGREKGREGTLEKCGELYFSVGCTM